jgi:putative ABC transport system substrate-binding protein
MISRRHFLLTSLAGTVTAPLVVGAQPTGKVYRIGFLGGGSATGYAPHVAALRLGLQDHGYLEGNNVTLEFRWAEGKYDRLPALAAELILLNVDVIVTQGTPAALAAKKATATIPIVMTIVGNPVETGIVTGMARPGGNITGSSFFVSEINAKRLEILKAALPASFEWPSSRIRAIPPWWRCCVPWVNGPKRSR